MNELNELVEGYENTRLNHYGELDERFPNSVWYDELPGREVTGVLKACRYVNGRLLQTYSDKENHVGVIAATRLGKTTSYVIPTVFSFARAKNKRSMVISDPKGEIYRHTAATLRQEGYEVLVLNFRDSEHSECWNPLTSIYRKYQSIFEVEQQVEVVTMAGARYEDSFRLQLHGKSYANASELAGAIDRWRTRRMDEIGNDIDTIAWIVAPTTTHEPFWGDAARELLKAFLWAMLEDSRPELLGTSGRTQITEDTYSFATIVTLMSRLNKSEHNFDDGYFLGRGPASRAYQIVKGVIPVNAQVTRQGVTSQLGGCLAVFSDPQINQVTRCNSFDMDILTRDDGQKPVALFIDYQDELKLHFRVISMFVQDAYRRLIGHANVQPDGKRRVPFYFILDEFGNFPAITDFETTISACAGRNIFFILIVQSYAQLNNVYGDSVAAIIRDNLNMHVLFGSNNPQTLEEFSRECGKFTRVAPTSVLNGTGTEMNDIRFETIPRVPISTLSRLGCGECIVTEANCGYVLFSKLERYYLCKEFTSAPLSDEKQYVGAVDPHDPKYIYTPMGTWQELWGKGILNMAELRRKFKRVADERLDWEAREKAQKAKRGRKGKQDGAGEDPQESAAPQESVAPTESAAPADGSTPGDGGAPGEG